MRCSTKAWCVVGGGIVAYEALCPTGETLSEGLDDFVERPIGKAVVAAIGALTVAHLINVLPNEYDPFHKIGKLRPIGDCDE